MMEIIDITTRKRYTDKTYAEEIAEKREAHRLQDNAFTQAMIEEFKKAVPKRLVVGDPVEMSDGEWLPADEEMCELANGERELETP